LPHGYVEALTLYPEHPVFDKYGRPTPFNESAFNEFQKLLNKFGCKSYLDEKIKLSTETASDTDRPETTAELPYWQAHASRIVKLQAPLLRQL
jgi:hypothetical protein